MCGRYTITITLDELMVRYMIDETMVPFHRPKYNVAPSQQVLAIISDGTRNRMGELKWGLVPAWADDPKVGFSMINARAETAATKPAFKEPFLRKRCLLPADSFYEWKVTSQGKQPMRIVKKDRSVFSMAGLYEIWISPSGEKLSSCTILTTRPNEVVAPIHDRMPVILQPEQESLWLDRQLQNVAILSSMLQPYPSELLEAYPVGNAVGNVRNDDPSLVIRQQVDEQLGLW
ncbi:SOS response-associated peptidase [Paenibacillus sp. L3-i20]|uniref:SOS response-associated peptidase n=1 Tax=Paenibacillus sp. L3-i20 TaxID=2905833 RepID=UPI001EE0628F|nr:SOS response-associated peptidase [Paenibacillus sp. L3-i20]GKU78518.1 putative SOS response-associated peptidase YoqW [Paenibacillus sp. L3-i20]